MDGALHKRAPDPLRQRGRQRAHRQADSGLQKRNSKNQILLLPGTRICGLGPCMRWDYVTEVIMTGSIKSCFEGSLHVPVCLACVRSDDHLGTCVGRSVERGG